MTEQIWANDLRFFRETSPRSGTPDGHVFTLPAGPTAVARRTEVWGGKVDVYRNPKPLTPLHEFHEGRMSLTVGLRFLGLILSSHATLDVGAGVYRFDRRRAETPTFCLEVSTPTDLFRFRGIAFQEIQVAAVPPELVSVDLAFQALDRQPILALTAATADLYSDPVSANRCVLAYTATTWGADPRVDNALDGTFSAQFFLTRRNLSPAQFMPDGRPTRFTSEPWRIMADLMTVASDLTVQAKFRAGGRLALFLGQDGADLEMVADVVTLFSNSDPVKAVDFREESLMAEAHPDAGGSLMLVRDNAGTWTAPPYSPPPP